MHTMNMFHDYKLKSVESWTVEHAHHPVCVSIILQSYLSPSVTLIYATNLAILSANAYIELAKDGKMYQLKLFILTVITTWRTYNKFTF